MTEAWQATLDEGLRLFRARTHTGAVWDVLASSWPDAGFYVNDDGESVADPNGNTVEWSDVEDLDPTKESHREAVKEWYG